MGAESSRGGWKDSEDGVGVNGTVQTPPRTRFFQLAQ